MMIFKIIVILNWAILFYFIILSLGYLMLLAGSIPDVFSRFKENEIIDIKNFLQVYSVPPVSVIIPFYNEEEIILDSIQSVNRNSYPNIQVILINDGSTDLSLKKVIEKFNFFPVEPLLKNKIKTNAKVKAYYISKTHQNMILIDKEHSDKSDSLNIGINANRCPLFISMDSDTLLDSDSISQIMFYFLRLSYPVAVGGSVYILNGCKFQDGVITSHQMSRKPIHIFQTCEYLRSFLFSRSGWNIFGGALCYAGAFTLFNNHSATFVGGYDVDNFAQDFEIIAHLHEYSIEKKFSYHIGYTPAAVAWTDVPSTLGEYWRQRFNWQYYSLKTLMKHKNMLFNPKYGKIGLFTFPFYFFGEILGVVVEFTAYTIAIVSLILGTLDPFWASMFFILCIGFSIFLTMATSLMSFFTFNKYQKLNDIVLIFIFSLIENFGFRQYGVICRMFATCRYFLDSLIGKNKDKVEAQVH